MRALELLRHGGVARRRGQRYQQRGDNCEARHWGGFGTSCSAHSSPRMRQVLAAGQRVTGDDAVAVAQVEDAAVYQPFTESQRRLQLVTVTGTPQNERGTTVEIHRQPVRQLVEVFREDDAD